MIWRSMASSGTPSSEKCRKENRMCSREMNEDFDLERKEDIAILSERLAKEMGYLLREVETVTLMSLRRLRIRQCRIWQRVNKTKQGYFRVGW